MINKITLLKKPITIQKQLYIITKLLYKFNINYYTNNNFNIIKKLNF